MLVTVYDEGSVTAAADRLGVTQSTVSHGINRLREVVGDALFVAKGRGITPTERAAELVIHAKSILFQLEHFSTQTAYDPGSDNMPFVIAASDYEIELIVKPFIRRLRQSARHVRLEILRAHNQHEWAALLREARVDLVLSPTLQTDSTDLVQQSVIRHDSDICYFDATQRDAPDTLAAYCDAHHIIFAPGYFHPTLVDKTLAALNHKRHIALSLPSFSAIASVIHGTDMVALMPSRLANTLFSKLDSCPPPFDLPSDTITQTWHIRSNDSPRHKWFRSNIKAASTHLS